MLYTLSSTNLLLMLCEQLLEFFYGIMAFLAYKLHVFSQNAKWLSVRHSTGIVVTAV